MPTTSACRRPRSLICRFWLIDALWSLGRREAARDLFTDALQHRNRYGLLSEDVDPQTGALWGNFPQTYSMAGLDSLGDAAVAQLGRPLLARLSGRPLELTARHSQPIACSYCRVFSV